MQGEVDMSKRTTSWELYEHVLDQPSTLHELDEHQNIASPCNPLTPRLSVCTEPLAPRQRRRSGQGCSACPLGGVRAERTELLEDVLRRWEPVEPVDGFGGLFVLRVEC